MRRWYWAFLASLVVVLFVTAWALIGSLALAIPTLIFMYQAAARALGSGYAKRQTMLAIGLGVVGGLGIVLVPLLVDSDIAKALSRPAAG
jgi:hypothetical protein